MAITITESPRDLTLKGQKLMYTCTSTNLSEDGFKFTVVVKDVAGQVIAQYYKNPNPSGVLMFDLRPVVQELIKVDTTDSQQGNAIIHNMPHAANQQFTVAQEGCKYFRVQFGEIYDSLTSPNLDLANDTIYLTDGYLQYRDGYRKDLTDLQPLGESSKFWLLDRDVDFNATTRVTGINIETHDEEYGVVGFWFNGVAESQISSYGYRYTVYDTDGVEADTGFVTMGSDGTPPVQVSLDPEDQQVYGAFYPGNLNSSDSALNGLMGVFKPNQVSGGWSYYTIQPVDPVNNTLTIGRSLAFINTCPPSKHTSVQLCWTNSVGGWEYLTFNGRRKDEVSSKSKNYTKDIGTYADTTFDFNAFDRQETSFHIDTTISYTLYRQNASDVDTRLLESLSKSKNVMVNLDGGEDPLWLPVIVTGNKFEMQPTTSSKNQTITVRIKLAQTEQA